MSYWVFDYLRISGEVIACGSDIDIRDAFGVGLPLGETRSRVIGKEEGLRIGLLEEYGAAKGGAELVLPKRRLNGPGEIVSRVQSGVAKEFKYIAVIVLCAGFVNQVDCAAVPASIACVGICNIFTEFLNRVDGRKDDDSETVMVFVVANPIEE